MPHIAAQRWRIFLATAMAFALLAPAVFQVASASPAAAASSTSNARTGSVASSAKLPAPSGVKVTFKKGYAQVSWNKVKGAKSYVVVVSKDGYSGPWAGHYTKDTTEGINYGKFPYRNQPGAYRISVRATNGSAASSVVRTQTVRAVGEAVSIKNKAKAKAKTESCLNAGLGAAATTLAGAVTVTAVSYVIPGVNAVTFSGSLLAAGGAGAGAYIVCVAVSG